MSDTDVTVLPEDADLEPAFEVRREVFVDEQGVDESIEIDGKDPDATHVLARLDDDPVGTARLRETDDDTGKVERVAVRADYRGDGVGRELVACIESVAMDRGLIRITVDRYRIDRTTVSGRPGKRLQ